MTADVTPTRASQQDGTHPRPQLLRPTWVELSGPWGFDHDDADVGLAEHWNLVHEAAATITVPFPPESAASGIGATGFHPVVWYRRELTTAEFAAAGLGDGPGAQGDRLLIHFGAVDYRASVWLNGSLLGHHEGGHVPFSFDATDSIDPARPTQTLVVRAEDDPHDIGQPRGKQDWQEHPHVIWYHRTTGIWQPVWLEAVPRLSIEHLGWVPDVPGGSVHLAVRLSRRPTEPMTLRVSLDFENATLAELSLRVDGDRIELDLPLARQINGQDYEHILWSPEHPRLLDARVELLDASADSDGGVVVDAVDSYLGLRSAAIGGGHFLLNDRPYYLRGVLEQGYWPESHLAAPSAVALRDEVQLILDLGFNTARVHQKIEDPRFLYWADRLGLLLWGEAPGAFEFSPTAVRRNTEEWVSAIDRDLSHPSIVVWVPLNESWGVQHIAHEPRVRSYARGLTELTRALDPSRPVITNDGWEHLDSDLWTIHDYESAGGILSERYGTDAASRAVLASFGPAGRRMRLSDDLDRGQPIMLTEFGGISFDVQGSLDDAWGYSTAGSPDDFERRLREILDAINGSRGLVGWVYTQLTDTLQETNGLTDENRVPKLPIETLRAMIQGTRP